MSGFRIFAIDMAPGDPDDIENDRFHPVAGDEPDSLLPEPEDGDDVRQLFCSSAQIRVPDEKKPVMVLEKIRMSVQITDCRIAFACTKYTKGGGWIGGPTALAMNAGSKMLAAHRRRGKILIGHIRYPWISGVYASSRHGIGSEETLRVVVGAGDDLLILNVGFPKQVDAAALGTELIHRIGAFRLAHTPMDDDDERAAFQALIDHPPLVSQKGSKQMAGVQIPTHFNISHESANFGRAVA